MEANLDALLPLSRRLDWRFLLPDPTLNRVVYLGPTETQLLEALQRFSREVVQSTASQGDLAVLINPSAEDFKQALHAANSFYVELHRPGWMHRLSQWAAPGTYLLHARTQGFQAEAYWHYPNFEAATRIIPLSATSPLLHVMAKDRHDLKTQLKRNGMAWLLKTGLLARVVSCLSIVGYKA